MTVASRLTASGRSAVAVIGLRGDDAKACVHACFQPAQERVFASGQIRYGVWTSASPDSSASDGESIVITPIADDEFEIHVHGGTAAVNQIMQSLQYRGVTVVDSDELQMQKGKDHLQLESESVLTRCKTTRSAALALEQCRSGVAAWVENELARRSGLRQLQQAAGRILEWESVGLHLIEPYRVVLAGPANVGKSSLINRIVGYGRTITHDAPGTTRDVIECETVIDGIAIRLSDTAGIRDGGGEIEREGIRRGAIAIGDADLVVIVVSPFCLSELPGIRARVQELAPQAETIEVLNQFDRLNDLTPKIDGGLPLHKTIALERSGLLPVSDGIEELMRTMTGCLRPVDPPTGQPIPISSRQVKWLREIVDCVEMGEAIKCLDALQGGTP